jgi:hypothetical protein
MGNRSDKRGIKSTGQDDTHWDLAHQTLAHTIDEGFQEVTGLV